MPDSPSRTKQGDSLLGGASLYDLIEAAHFRAEQMMTDECEHVGGDIAASRAWFELRSLSSKLRVAASHAALIERLQNRV